MSPLCLKRLQTIFTVYRLYVANLNEKLQKTDLRRELYLLFSTYGPVLDIVTLKTSKMRGQAHIVYRDIQTAIQALRQLDGFEFFGRPLVSIQ
jgi:U2 small nuclear ribonucleoprotein B''